MFAALKVVGGAFLDICLMRQGPQDLPESALLLVLALCFYALSNVLLAFVTQPVGLAFVTGTAECVIVCVLNYGVLYLRGAPRRWLQTTTAMSGAGAFFSLISIPCLLGLQPGTDPGPLRYPLYLVLVVLLIWNVSVIAHILRHALSVAFVAGLLVAIAYLWLINQGIDLLLPQGPAA